jgi:signal transduction histidine kinase
MANSIVVEVLDFVRPIRLQVEDIRLDEVIGDAAAMAESHRNRGEVVVALNFPEDLPGIQGDPYQLRQIFTNLLTNAFEAMNGTGEVTITAAQLPPEEEIAVGSDVKAVPMIQVEVDDSGPGFSPDVIDKMFSPFFTTKPQGSGLGLAIVRKIVDAHDGRIEVSARAQGGARFRITLPVTGSHELFR